MYYLITTVTKLGTRHCVIPARTDRVADNFARDCAFAANSLPSSRVTAIRVDAKRVKRPNVWSADLADVLHGEAL
jgi:hypothetical protein